MLLYSVFHEKVKYLVVLSHCSGTVSQCVGVQHLDHFFGLKFCYYIQWCTFMNRSPE